MFTIVCVRVGFRHVDLVVNDFVDGEGFSFTMLLRLLFGCLLRAFILFLRLVILVCLFIMC